MAFAFEKLIVCQKAFADVVCTLRKGFPTGCFLLDDQLSRAAVTFAAGIAEAKHDVNVPADLWRGQATTRGPHVRVADRPCRPFGEPTA